MTWLRWETFGADYLLLVFMVSLGVLQLAAAWRRLGGLSLFFRRRCLGYIFAVVIIGAGYWLFFSEPRDIPDYAGGLGGSQQFIYTLAGIAIASLLTFSVSSALNARWGRSGTGDEEGLDALKRMTYLQAVKRGFKGKSR